MENQLQTVNHGLSMLQVKEIEIAKIIWHVNQLVAYPLTDFQIEAWAKSVNELMPDVDLSELKKLIDNFKMGIIEWDSRKGIQNIFIALNQVNNYNRFVNHDDRP